MSWSLLVVNNDVKSEVVVRLVNIGGIIDILCLISLFTVAQLGAKRCSNVILLCGR